MKGKELLKLCKVYKGEAQNPYSDFENKTIWIAEREVMNKSKQVDFKDSEMFYTFVTGAISNQAQKIEFEDIDERRKYWDLSHSYYQPQ